MPYEAAKRVENLSYAIRDVSTVAREVLLQKRVHFLNIGDPGLYPEDFPTPRYICDALAAATYADHNQYADSIGVLELRHAIVQSERRRNRIDLPMDNIIITSGVSEAIYFANASLINPGDQMLVPGPLYPPYKSYCEFFGGKPVEYCTCEDDHWLPDLDDLRAKVTDRTKAILLSTPNNPTGTMYPESYVRDIIDVAGENDLVIISDEIYDQIIFEGDYSCPGTIAGEVPVIGMNGFSKAHMATGWRLGYMYFLDPEHKLDNVRAGIEKLARTRLCANVPAQYAAIESYKNPNHHTADMVVKLRRRRDYMYKRFQEFEAIHVELPDGTFYMFPRIDLGERWADDKEFVIDLLRQTGVCFVFGSGFGEYGKGHFRTTFLPPINELQEVFEKLHTFLG